MIDETHDPGLQSWVASANEPASDFPIQNLPLGRLRRPGESDWSIGMAIGTQVLDLRRAGLVDHGDTNRLFAQGPGFDGNCATRFLTDCAPTGHARLGSSRRW